MGQAARIKKAMAQQGGMIPVGFESFVEGLEALRSGDKARGIDLLRRAIVDKPRFSRAHFHLAMALREQARFPEAIEHYRTAISLEANYVDAQVNLAEALRRSGSPREAISLCDQAVAIAPRHGEAYLVRGVAQNDIGDLEGAVADLEQAILRDPQASNAHKILGKILMGAKRREEALVAFRKAGALAADDAEVQRFIGELCDATGRLAEGLAAFEKAMALDPRDIPTYIGLSGLLCRTDMLELVLAVTDVAIKLEPNWIALHYNRAVALEKLNRLDESLLSYAEALRQNPKSGQALISTCRLQSQLCDWDGLESAEDLARTMTYKAGHATAPFGLLMMTSSLSEILECNKVWSRSIASRCDPLTIYAPRAPHRRGDRLRIGYLSADFHVHATAALVVELFELHDRTRFETWGYSIGMRTACATRQRLIGSLDHFEDLSGLSYDEAAAHIHRDEIDILIDLKGYTFQARPEILARRPAPIQVNFLGYPSTMGAPFIDYVVGDPIVTPMEHAAHYTEKIVQLPHTYQPNDRKRSVAPTDPTRQECGLPENAFVFCCFNAPQKITSKLFAIWMRLLQDVPNSVLWLYAKHSSVPANLRREAMVRGIAPERLVFAPTVPAAEHLARMAVADLFLDTSPYGAHTTASEALWVGLPVLTCKGEAFAARVGASLIEAVGLPELVVSNHEDYEAMARHLASRPEELGALRAKLNANRVSKPLFDTPLYVRNFENALTRMAEIRDAGEAPRAFAV